LPWLIKYVKFSGVFTFQGVPNAKQRKTKQILCDTFSLKNSEHFHFT